MLDALARFPNARAILLIGSGINEIDVSGAEKLHAIAERLQHSGVSLYLSSMKPQVLEVLSRAHIEAVILPERAFRTKEQALRELHQRYGAAMA